MLKMCRLLEGGGRVGVVNCFFCLRIMSLMVLLSLPLLLGVGADGDRATGGRDMTGACCRGSSITPF